MSAGSLIVVSGTTRNWRFASLSAIQTVREDPNAFDELLLQTLVDQSPNVLPVREFLNSSSVLVSLGCEIPVDIGDCQGRIDNLLVTTDGYPVIVETKLYRNREATREVVTQTLQYGMAIGHMPLLELEAKIKKVNPSLLTEKTLRDCVLNRAGEEARHLITDDFEESLERHLRRGEILLLVVSDGIHVGVERVTNWLNEQGNSAPFKFGLVELKFFTLGDQLLVVPRTALKTREISRHVVTVDIQPTGDVSVAARVTDEFRNTSGGKVQESRSVKAAPIPLTKSSLLQLVAPEARQSAENIVEQLEKFDQRGTSSFLSFGFNFPEDGGDFHSLAYLGKRGIWVYPLKKDRDLLGDDAMLRFHREANAFGMFFRDHQLSDPNSNGSEVKYQMLDNAPAFASFLDDYRNRLNDLLNAVTAP